MKQEEKPEKYKNRALEDKYFIRPKPRRNYRTEVIKIELYHTSKNGG